MKIYNVKAIWDDEASVWSVDKSDVPGLCAEAETLPKLEAYLLELIPELLALNAPLLPDNNYHNVPIDLVAEYHNRLKVTKVA